MISEKLISGTPHWLYDDGTALPIMAGGQDVPPWVAEAAGAPVKVGGAGQPPPQNLQQYAELFGLNPQQVRYAQDLVAGGMEPMFAAQGAADIFSTGPFAPAPPRGFAPAGAPAFSGTEAGLRLQGQLGMEQQGLVGRQGMEQQGLVGQQQMEQRRLMEEEAFRRQLAGELGAGVRGEMDIAGAYRQGVMGEMGAGARAQLGEEGAYRRGVLGEMGAGARSQMELATQRAISAGQRVGETFGQMGQMMASPSDYLKLAYNVQGMTPMAGTPTDLAREGMQKFHQQQLGLAGAPQQNFGDVYGGLQGNIPGASSYGDIYGGLQGNIPEAGPSFAEQYKEGRGVVGGFQFGGGPRGAAIAGERGKAELVEGDNLKVTPNLSPNELRALRLAGVGGGQFGLQDMRKRSEQELQQQRQGNIGQPDKGYIGIPQGPVEGGGQAWERPTRQRPLGSPNTQVGGQQPGATRPQNVFDIPQQRPGAAAPLFSGGYGQMGRGGIGGVTGLAALNPLDYSYQQINQMLPFEQQMLASRFGESIINPATGQVQRAGLDPASLAEIIRRSSWMGGAQGASRWG